MSNYTKTTNFAVKDTLPSGDTNKIVRGTEIDAEFNALAVASATKANKTNPSFTGEISIGSASVNETELEILDGATVTTTELNYVDGVTSPIQTQINTKLNSSTVSAFGATLIDDADASAARTTLGLGTAATTASTDYATAAQGTTADAALPKAGGAMTGAITTNSTFDGRDVATDGTKLDGIEAGADVTDTTNVTAAGALMDSEVTNLAQVKAFDSADYATAAQGTKADAALPTTGGAMTGAITTNSTFDGRDVATDGTKLDGIEAGADVTDTTNVVAALSAGTGISLSAGGEIANTSPDQTVALTGAGTTTITGTYPNFTITSTGGSGGTETLAQTLVLGNTTGGTDLSVSSGDNIVMAASSTVDGRDVSVDGAKLDGIEAGADVTDTANVTAAGALMDSELTSEASVKALNQGVATTDSPSFAGLTVDTTTLAVDSTNNRVGIGTNSPSTYGGKLNITDAAVGGESTLVIANNNANQFVRVGINNNTAQIAYDNADSLSIGQATDSTTAGLTTEHLRITSDGVVEFKAGITEDSVTLTGTSTTINLATATNFVHDLTGATTYTFSNPATTGNATAFTLKIIQDATARTITWPASVDWAGGTAPTLTATSGGVDVFVFYTIDGGTTYYGFTAGQAMA